MSVVEDIYVNNRSRKHIEESRRERPVVGLRKAVEQRAAKGKLALIAEFKKQSPSGFMSGSLGKPEDYFGSLPEGMVSGFSVLTEPTRFGGRWDDLTASQSFHVPLLAKDFFESEKMIHDAYFCGADAVLLIADFIGQEALHRLASKAAELGMDALIEFHDPECAELIPLEENVLVGYNRRNLRTMKMEGEEEKVRYMFEDTDTPYILESGIDASNARNMDFTGYSGLLIGSSIITGESVIDVLKGRGTI